MDIGGSSKSLLRLTVLTRMQQDVSLQLPAHPFNPYQPMGRRFDLQMRTSRHGASQHAFGYVCDIFNPDWASRATKIYAGGTLLRMNTPKGSCISHTHD
ncbi:hypothetical protein F5B19DRAFT_488944 [Rostrohypoxylon terebratum]|nr:hypothetical protein F5B19DRAFT_488944 [Rostrohypoxylon terebratum]